MRTLTVLQPWAGLILTGEKHIETRGWNTNIRGRVAIHAGVNEKFLKEWPRSSMHWACNVTGCVLGTVEIVDCIPLNRIAERGYLYLATEKERRLGDWSPGRYGFVLRNPILFDKPIAAKGKQGWWDWQPPKGGIDGHA